MARLLLLHSLISAVTSISVARAAASITATVIFFFFQTAFLKATNFTRDTAFCSITSSCGISGNGCRMSGRGPRYIHDVEAL